MTPSLVYADRDPAYRAELLAELFGRGAELELRAVAIDGHAALAAIREHRPDIALVDATLDGLNGVRIAELVGRTPALRHTRVVVLSRGGPQAHRRIADLVGKERTMNRRVGAKAVANALSLVAPVAAIAPVAAAV